MENESSGASRTSSSWRDLAQDLSVRLHTLHARAGASRPDYYNELYDALYQWRQTRHRKEMLMDAASVSLKRMFDESSHKSEWVDVMTHAFYDGVIKAGMNIDLALQADMPEIAANALVEMTRTMDDVIHNYRSMAPRYRAPAVHAILEQYEDVLIPMAHYTLDTLARDHGWTDERVAKIQNDVTARGHAGLDHLAKLAL